MNPLTAVNFLLLGAFVLVNNLDMGQGIKKVLSLLITVFILVPALINFSDFVLHTHYNADRFFTDTRTTTYKMTLVTNLNFILVGIALLLSNFSSSKAKLIGQYFVIGSLYMSLIGLFGYLYNIGFVENLASLTPMPLHTSILFTIIGICLLLQNPDEGLLKPITTDKSGGKILKGVLQSLLALPFAVGLIHFFFNNYNDVNSGFWVAAFVVTAVLIAMVVVWFFCGLIGKMDSHLKEDDSKLIAYLLNLRRYESLIAEVGSMTKVGVWEMYLSDDISSYWSDEIYSIYKLNNNVLLTFETTLKYYKPDSKKILTEHYQKTISDGIPYDLELKLLTSNTKEIWVRVVGKPIIDAQGIIIGVRGTIQDIDDQKRRELLLQISLDLIEDQNKRLLGFSHIVSHNLLSHSNNLDKYLDALQLETTDEKLNQLASNIRETSESISIAIQHLNEVVRIETNIDHSNSKSEVKFQDTLKQVTETLKPQINSADLTINADFSECETIHYLPQYLESILLNFTHNTMKYKEEGKPAVVNLKTNVVNNKTILTFSDNTMGIDPKKDRDRVLEMYKSFQDHANAKGTWLFLAKSQVESLGGNLEIQSVANEGTAFKITL